MTRKERKGLLAIQAHLQSSVEISTTCDPDVRAAYDWISRALAKDARQQKRRGRTT